MPERIWKKILNRPKGSLLALAFLVLWPLSLIYRLVVKLNRSRQTQERVRVSSPVISVGNISVGGSGKTPIAGLLADFLEKEKLRVGIASSGYGRGATSSVLARGYEIQKMTAEAVGDEVCLLADLLPSVLFAVDHSKSVAARALDESGEVDLIIVDDGFQHRYLHRDLDIVTFDAAVEERQLRIFPCGVLRESFSALADAGVIIVTRSDFARDISKLDGWLRRYNSEAPIYHARFGFEELVGHNERRPVKYLVDRSVFLFAGIGNFRPFEKQVSAICADLDCAVELSDHQKYDRLQLQQLKDQADRFDSDLIITTAKDWVKIGDFDFGREIYYLVQSIDLDQGEEKLVKFIKNLLDQRG